MTKTLPASLWLLVASTLAACGSSSNAPTRLDAHPDAATTPDAQSDATDGGRDATADASDGQTAAPEMIAPPGLTKQLVSGRASLVGAGLNSCTNEPGATGDRWCGFAIPAATDGFYELWVFNASLAASGADIKCDGTDTTCLRLTTNAYFDRFNGPGNDGFQGDTLIYQTDPDPTAQTFLGTIAAWRPGWTAGRALTAATGVVCSGHGTQQVALCLQARQANADGDVSYELVAGPLPAAGGGPLPLVERVLTEVSNDPAGSGQFQVGFSPDGASIAWSARPTATGEETLHVQKIDDATTRQTVATNVSAWEISADGTSWLWLRGYNHDDLAPSGTLELAAFPAGGDVSTLAMNVADYLGVGDKGVLYRADVVHTLGDLRLMPDRAAPATTKLLDQMVATVLTIADDASTVVYTKTITGIGNDIFAWSSSLATPCTVWATPSANRTVTLLAANKVLVWAQEDVMSQVISAAATSIATCATTTFGTDLLRWIPADDGRLLFVDGAKDGAYTGILRAMNVDAQGAAALRTPLSAVVDPVYAPLLPAAPAVVYTVASGGLYIYVGPLL